MKPAKVSLLHRLLQCLKQCVDCNTKSFTAINIFVNILLISAVISFPYSAAAHGATQSGDQYSSFEELERNEDPASYRITEKNASSADVDHGHPWRRHRTRNERNRQ